MGGVFGGASGVLYDKTANQQPHPLSPLGQVRLAAGSPGEPMLAFSDGTHPAGNYDTGIYKVSANQLGISAASTLELGISNLHISAQQGSAGNPSYNFGVTGADTNTGMYRPTADAIGFSAGGVEKASIYAANSGNFIEGLNVGLTTNIAGIRRLSSTAVNSWEDGHMGNSELLVFTPGDFQVEGPTGAGTYSIDCGDETRGPTRNLPFLGITSASQPLVATKLIPKGFIISAEDRALIRTGTAGSAVNINNTDLFIYSQTFGTGGAAGAGTTIFQAIGSYNTNNNASFTGSSLAGDGLTYVIICWIPNAQLTIASSGLIGASISMTRI